MVRRRCPECGAKITRSDSEGRVPRRCAECGCKLNAEVSRGDDSERPEKEEIGAYVQKHWLSLLPLVIAVPVGLLAIIANFFVPSLFLFITIPLCLAIGILGFVQARALAIRQGHWIAFDYLESYGSIRYVLLVGFFFYYGTAYLVMWWVAQVKSTMAKPKRLIPWVGLQVLSVVLCCGGFTTAFFGDRTRAANRRPEPAPFQAANVQAKQGAKNENGAGNAAVAAAVTGDAVLDKTLAELESGNQSSMRAAAATLGKMQPNEHRPVVVKKLTEQIAGSRNLLRTNLIRALGVWSTNGELPVLLRLLEDPDITTRNEVLDALGKIADERSAAAAAKCLVELSTRFHAEAALKSLGPMAEKEVAKILSHSDYVVCITAVGILQDIGTQESIAPLEAAGQANVALRLPSANAVAAIRKRAKS